MERGVWKSPVVIEMYGRPGSVIIMGTLDAALMLIGAWPTKRTETHLTAVMTCRDVLTGNANPGLARANFIEAALEAGYRIEPETFLSDRWDLTPLPEENPRPAVGLADLIRRRALTTGQEPEDNADNGHPEARSPPGGPLPRLVVLNPALQHHPGLRELLTRLLHLLGLIGAEIGRSLAGLFSLGSFRGTDRQPH